ncbi:BRD4-interacting chromatin-remodeling complex-associated protein-like [Armigeres subalbatus]|uniref:BRD4-interacting chromatin-remodeling complex-associated protein-like n=1 Tax=Armigeres subalbatus TaxID=124917 RepID=UPI002ED3C8DE
MVCCDRCDEWFHFICVGVNEDVANRSWSCPECSASINPASQLPPPPTSPTATTGEPPIRPPSPSPPPIHPSRTPTPRPRNSMIQTPPPPQVSTDLPPVPSPRPRAHGSHMIPSSTFQRSQGLLTPVAEVTEVRSASRNMMEEEDLVNRLPSDLRIQFLEQQEAIELRYLRRRFQMLLDSSSSVNHRITPPHRDNVTAPVSHSSPVCSNQVAAPSTARNNIVSPFVPIAQPQPVGLSNRLPTLNEQLDDTNKRLYIPALRSHPAIQRPAASTFQTDYLPSALPYSHPPGNQRTHASAFAPSTSNLPPIGHEFYPSAIHDDHTAVGGVTLLNRSQIAARHAVPKELPIFTGEPEEWPLFFASYENTTHLCGLTAEENMIRLQRCLKERR